MPLSCCAEDAETSPSHFPSARGYLRFGYLRCREAITGRPGRAACDSLGLCRAIANAWIEEAIYKIHTQIGRYKHRRRHQNKALNLRVIAVGNGVDAITPQSWNGEELFDDDCTAHHEPHLQAHHRHGWDQRVFQRMF